MQGGECWILLREESEEENQPVFIEEWELAGFSLSAASQLELKS